MRSEGKHLKPWVLGKPAPNVCQACAVDHDQIQPHNQESLYYQYYFYGEYGRWPTWSDAMAHCSDDVKALWVDALRAEGVAI